jgi:tryptophan synthase alpha chain
MSAFFEGPAPGLALLLTAGAQPPAMLTELTMLLDERGVDCLELAVPFPNSVTDGPVLLRSAERALARGAGLAETLAFVAEIRPRLGRLRIAVLADWRHTVAPLAPGEFERQVAGAGADGVLVHGLPPRLRGRHLAEARAAALPVVTTCYAVSTPAVRAAAARDATAYVYLVAHYGRTGTAPVDDYSSLSAVVGELKETARVPIAVGFGVRSRADISRIADTGADAAIVGTAAAASIDCAVAAGRDPVNELDRFLRSLM